MAAKGTLGREDIERLARRVPEDIATDGDLDLVDEVFAADSVEHGPMGDFEGLEEIRAQFEAFGEAFDDFSATVEDVVAEGDTVAMRVTLRGTHTGELMGIGPTDREFEVANLVWTRIEDGQIVERWAIPDMVSFLGQLGIEELPAPATA